jgi:hypothetical protein
LVSSDEPLKPERLFVVQQWIHDLFTIGALPIEDLNVPLMAGTVVGGGGYGVQKQNGIAFHIEISDYYCWRGRGISRVAFDYAENILATLVDHELAPARWSGQRGKPNRLDGKLGTNAANRVDSLATI